MLVYLVRHGETAHNRDGLGLGRDDVPLTPRGLAQADAVARRLAAEPIRAVYTSPLQRASVVAQKIAELHGLRPEPCDDLIELDVGMTEGLPLAEVRRRHPEFIDQWRGVDGFLAVMPGGESLADVDRRLTAFIDRLLAAPTDGAVAVVSHNFVIRLAICRLLGLEGSRYRSFVAGLASVSAIRADGDQRVAEFVNDICHLAALEP